MAGSRPGPTVRAIPVPLLTVAAALAACSGVADPEGPAGAPAKLEWADDDPRSGIVGNLVAPPRVRVRDDAGRPVSGVAVTFLASPDGQLGRQTDTTDARGMASPGGWRLASVPGSHQLRATAAGRSVSFAVPVSAPPAGGFQIGVIFDGQAPTPAEAGEIAAAIERWQRLVVGDLPDVKIAAAPKECPALLLLQGRSVDDLLLLVTLSPTIGDQVVATTSVCLTRDGSRLPAVAAIEIRLPSAKATAGLAVTMAHEIGHALGLGTTWNGKLQDTQGDLRFTGRSASAAYWLAAGRPSESPEAGVPVEVAGPASVARAHWRESILDEELMTPYSEGTFGGPSVEQPLSAITVAALRDLGYVVDDRGADPFVVGGALVSCRCSGFTELLQPFAPMTVTADGRRADGRARLGPR